MLRWRLPLGTCLIAALAGLFWLDHIAPTPGIALLPLLIVFVLLGTQELMDLAAAGGMRPVRLAVFGGNVMIVLAPWLALVACGRPGAPRLGGADGDRLGAAAGEAGVALALAAALALVWVAEMWRFRKPGGGTAGVAAAVFALVYVGLLGSFLVQLRLNWGIGGLASLLVVVKLGDTGAYAVGRLVGRHQMAPRLSPGKTIEGAVGGLVFSSLGSVLTFRWIVPALASGHPVAGWWWRSILFGLLVGLAGMAGDLAESHLKRDARKKDSSGWMPGFGGCLDLLDSILLAGPVAYALWSAGLVS